MHLDYIIVGQGICGTFLYRYLSAAGFKVMVIDEARLNTASKVASGVINPVTGRRIVKTWLIDEVMPFAKNAYKALGEDLQITAIRSMSIVDFFPTPQITEAFKKRYSEDSEFLALPENPSNWDFAFNNEFGYGEITPAYLVNLPDILIAARQQMRDDGTIRETTLDVNELRLSAGGVWYDDLSADAIIFCDGVAGADNPYFRNLPFGANKGEAVLVTIDEMPDDHIYKKGFSLVPWKDNIFWLGSTYLWEFEDDRPTPGFYRFAENWLKQTLKLPFQIVDHLAAVRPATLERRPFVGFHPLYPQVGIFNGMGTKGCSLAPFFANQFVQKIKTGEGLYKEADVSRFTKILSRT
jgi:glycine/D-amino acid oxidase-like deaminating enzyme